MLSSLTQRANRLAEAQVERTILRLASMSLPPGVTSEVTRDGVVLRGKQLKQRVITDPDLRNFGR
jgi:hypothetical protein